VAKQDVNVRISSKFDKSGVDQARRGLSGLGGTGKSVGSSLSAGMLKASAAVTAVVIAARQAAKVIGDLSSAYGEQERAENRLTQAVKNNPMLDGGAAQGLMEYASALQRVSIYGDEQILQQAQFLASLELSEDQIESVLDAAVDFASTGKVSLESAVQNIAKTFGGLTGELGELIPELKDLTKEELEQGKAVDILSAKYDGMAEVLAGDTLGTMTQFQNAFGDLKEVLGSFVAEFLTPLVRGVTGFVTALTDAINKIREARGLEGGGGGPPEDDLLAGRIEDLQNRQSALKAVIEKETAKLADMPPLIAESTSTFIDGLRTELEQVNAQLSELGVSQTPDQGTGAAVDWSGIVNDTITELSVAFAELDEEAETFKQIFGVAMDNSEQKAELLQAALLDMAKAGFNPEYATSYESGINRVIRTFEEYYSLLRDDVIPTETQRLRIAQEIADEYEQAALSAYNVADVGVEHGGSAEEEGEESAQEPNYGSSFGELGAILSGGDPIMLFVSAVAGAAMQVEAVQQILNGLTTSFVAMFEVLDGPLTAALTPVIDYLVMLADAYGKILAPIIGALAPIIGAVISILETAAVPMLQLLSLVLSPVAMVLEMLQPILLVFAATIEVLTSPLRWVGDLLEWLGVKLIAFGEWAGLIIQGKWRQAQNVEWGGEFSSDAFSGLQGRIDAIFGMDTAPGDYGSIGDVTPSTSVYGGSTTVARQPDVNLYLTVEGNVIGAGGLAEVGELVSNALIEYTSIGGNINVAIVEPA